MKFYGAFYVLAALVATSLATVVVIEGDIKAIGAQAQELDTGITNFPATGASIGAALAIHTNTVDLGVAIDKGTADVKAVTGSFSESDGQDILDDVKGIEPIILDALTQIVNKKPAFAALPVAGFPELLLEDLKNLRLSTTGFGDALISNMPTDLLPEARSIKSDIDAAFTAAIAAYF